MPHASRSAVAVVIAFLWGCTTTPTVDGGTPADAASSAGLDAAQGVDAALPADAARAMDAALPSDAGSPADASQGRDAALVGDAAASADASTGSFEACCAATGCAEDVAMAQCLALPAAYGACSAAGEPGQCVDTAWCGGTYVNTAGLCPGPANIQCCTPAGSTQMCQPTDQPTPNASLMPVEFSPNCLPGMTLVGTFCVDVFEAFVRELLPDGGTAEWSPYFNPGTRSMVAISAAGAVPQGYINANQAEAACQNAGKRLCTDTEWLLACRGAANRNYPYGTTRQDGVCNDARAQHPAVELFPNDPTPFDRIQEPCINQLPQSVDPAGSNVGCVTPEGVLDLMGNLHEWTSDPAGTFRGGYYVDTRINGQGCPYATTAHDRSHWDYSTGFRCCADALP